MDYRKPLTIMGLVLGSALVGVIGVYVWWFHYKLGMDLSPERSDWGTLGDYVGGLLNPLISLCAFYWLGSSVRLQMVQMKAAAMSMEETAKQQTEQAQLTLASQRTESINLELSSVLNELNFHQNMLAMWLQHANKPNQPTVVIDENNRPTALAMEMGGARKRIKELTKERDRLLSQIKPQQDSQI